MRQHNCDICGKAFVYDVGNMYKLTFAGKTYRFCGYNCYMQAKRTKEAHNSAEYKRYKDS